MMNMLEAITACYNAFFFLLLAASAAIACAVLYLVVSIVRSVLGKGN
jgi:hypothetical protein